MKTHVAMFNRFSFELPHAAVIDCHHVGACDADVNHWYPKLNLQLDPASVRAELKEYGAWDTAELADHETNVKRLIWIAAGNIQEDMTLNDSEE